MIVDSRKVLPRDFRLQHGHTRSSAISPRTASILVCSFFADAVCFFGLLVAVVSRMFGEESGNKVLPKVVGLTLFNKNYRLLASLPVCFITACIQVDFATAQDKRAVSEIGIPELDQTKIVRSRASELSLAAGEETSVELSIINQTANAIHFDKVKTSCNCSRPEVTKTVFEPNVLTKARLVWRPTANASGIASTTITFLHEGALVLDLIVFAKLDGMLLLESQGIGERQTDGFVVWGMPITCTEPLVLGQLDVQLGSSMEGFVAEILEASNLPEDVLHPGLKRGVVKFSAPRVLLEEKGDVFGAFKLLAKTSNVVVERRTVFSSRPLLKISPAMVVFRDDEEDSDRVVATVMAQLDRAYFPPERTTEIKFEAFMNGHAVHVESKHLGNSVYRFKLHALRREVKVDDEYEFVFGAGIDARHAKFAGVAYRE
jgi:hypothetical protein